MKHCQTTWVLVVALVASGGCPEDDDSSPPVTETPGVETPTPESATPEATPVPFTGDFSTGEYVDMVGFQYGDPSGQLTDVDIEFALLSPYEGFQDAEDHAIAYYPRATGSGGAVTISIRTDELGARIMHLQAPGVAPGDIVLLGYTADGSTISRPAADTSGWQDLPLPTDSIDYPEEVTTYLTLDGEGMEVTSDIQDFAESIATSGDYPGTDTIKGYVCATVAIIDTYEYVSPASPAEKTGTAGSGTVSKMPNNADAQTVLETEQCICVECARLACAVYRSMNIPCRTASRLDPLSHTSHTWSQIYIEDFGWIDVDPQRGECPKQTQELYHLIDPTGDDASIVTFRTDPLTGFRVLQPDELQALIDDDTMAWGWVEP